MSIILGICGGLGHMGQDASAAIIYNGELVYAMEEERFSRHKHARSVMPTKSIFDGLKSIKKTIKDVEFVAYYANYSNFENDIKSYFKITFGYAPKIIFFDHHLCHAASAFFPSQYKNSIIFTADYSGDGVSTTLSLGRDKEIKFLKKFEKPNSLGMFYAGFTQVLGFSFDNDEYKVMGLAPYGKNNYDLSKIISVSDNGDYLLKKDLINTNLKSRQSPLFNEKIFKLLKINKYFNNNKINQDKKDLAFSVQLKLEEIIIKLLKNTYQKTKIKNLCMAGGVSLNCAVVKKIADLKIFDNIFVQPASSDAGTALGAACLAYIKKYNKNIYKVKSHVYLGNKFNNDKIKKILTICNLKYKDISKNNTYDKLLEEISQNKIVSIFRGRHEFGPRALGNRSIIANPRKKNMKSILNNKIKFREGFRPFAPVVTDKLSSKYFHLNTNIKNYKHMNINVSAKSATSKKFPSCVHVDDTSRVQIIEKKDNDFIYNLLSELEKKYEIDCLINTSFNLNEMPIVNTPQDALSSFYSSGIDYLLIGNFLISKDQK